LVIGTTGGRPVSALERALSKNAMVFSYLPWDEVLEHASVFVTNGGFGSVCRALGLGLPMVVAGKGEDKADVAMRVAHAGAGIDLRTDRPTPEALRDAIDAVLKEESSYRIRAKENRRRVSTNRYTYEDCGVTPISGRRATRRYELA
jgi:UDP:flavonoid glycosyltransferase YjiC (YdhE family)